MVDIGSLIGAGTAATAGVAQIGMGIIDTIKGKKQLKSADAFWQKNKFQLPESAIAALDLAERQAQGYRLPGEDIRRAQIGEATASGLGAAENVATSSSDVLSLLSSLYGQQQTAEQNLALAGAERYDRNQEMLGSELNRMAGLEVDKWKYNSLYPYEQMLGRAEAFSTRGRESINTGLTTLGQTAGGYSQLSSEERQNEDFMKQMGLR